MKVKSIFICITFIYSFFGFGQNKPSLTFKDSIAAVANDPLMHEDQLLLVKVTYNLQSPKFKSAESKIVLKKLFKATEKRKSCEEILKLENYEEVFIDHVFSLCRMMEINKQLKGKYPYYDNSLYFSAILKQYISIHPEVFQAHIDSHSK